jgi:UDP-glucose 4-epimerase
MVERPHAINIGTGIGHSLREIISLISKHMQTQIAPVTAKPRQGDSAELIADVDLASQKLEYKTEKRLLGSINSFFLLT